MSIRPQHWGKQWNPAACLFAALAALSFISSVRSDTIINSDIDANTTWTQDGSPYIIEIGLDVNFGATLTIDADVQVRFNAGTGLSVHNGGGLLVGGDPGQPVVFTSNVVVPGPGDWANITINNGATATIEHCDIAYAGASTTDALRIYSTDSVTVSDCDIHDNLDEGLLIGGGAGVSPEISDVIIRNNGDGAVEQGGDVSPVYSNMSFSGNGENGILLTGDYNAVATLDGSGLNGARFVATTDIDVNASGQLTLAAGTTLAFNENRSLRVNNGGELLVSGSPGNSVVLTSNAAVPVPGDWVALSVFTGGAATLNHCEISYAGRSLVDALRISSTAVVTVSDCDIHHNLDEGLGVSGGAGVSPVFTNVTIRDNGDGAVEQGGDTSPVYDNVTLTGNGEDGIYLSGDYSSAVTLDGSGLNGAHFTPITGIDIFSAGELTVAANTTVAFASGSWLDVENGGSLLIAGTPGNTVIFTSNSDSPLPGDWSNINIYAGGAADFENCEIAHGGAGTNVDALRIYSAANVTVSDCDIHHNLDEGVLLGGGAGVSPVFTNVSIRDNGDGAVEQGSDTSPVYENVTLTGNGADGIYLTGDYSSIVNLDGSGLNGAPFIPTTTIDVISGGDLSIAAGTTLAFADNAWLDVENGGNLEVKGTLANPVIFTSIATVPAPGDWNNINVRGSGTAGFENCRISYAGKSATDAVRMSNTEGVTFNACEFHHNLDGAVQVQAGSKARIMNSLIRDNGAEGIHTIAGAELIALNNTITGNGTGVVADGSDVELVNNIISHNTTAGISASNGATVLMAYNDIFNPSGDNYLGLADQTGLDGNISSDPLYVGLPGREYVLDAGSPAVDSGTSAATPLTDYLGKSRFDNHAVPDTGDGSPSYFDMGAFEQYCYPISGAFQANSGAGKALRAEFDIQCALFRDGFEG